jgi:hypothetical protein
VVARTQFVLSAALLARAAVARGPADGTVNVAAAEAALEAAAFGSWNTAALETRAVRRLARGDTAAAITAPGLLTADPLRGTAFADTVRAQVGRFHDPAALRTARD